MGVLGCYLIEVINSFAGGVLTSERLVIGVTIASELCRCAQAAHALAPTSAIGLGRLMIAAVLTSRTQHRSGSLSLQVLAKGRLHQIFTDINAAGDVRGFVKPTDLAMPLLSAAERSGRREIGHAVGTGILSMIRIPDSQDFTQSSTELVCGEIDADVEHFLATSDQIPSALIAEVLFGDDDKVCTAGGVLVQALPGGSLERLNAIRAELREGRLAESLAHSDAAAPEMLRGLFPTAEVPEAAMEVRWKCRCSRQRVLAALAMLDPADLADMANEDQPVEVACDFCATSFTVSPKEVSEIFDAVVRARSRSGNN